MGYILNTVRTGGQIYEKARKVTRYNRETLQTNHIQNATEQDRIDGRSNPISQPTNFTTNSVDCAVKWLLFGRLYFFMVILLSDTTLQVQEISQNSTLPKWKQLDQQDN